MEDVPDFNVQLRMGLKNRESFGKGKTKLLTLVKELGSILKAANEMGMSYRHAWGKIKRMESDIGAPLVVSRRGGSDGGETVLTALGEELLRVFDEKTKEVELLLKYGRKPALTVDGIIFEGDSFLAVKRKNEPFRGMFAFPGGFVDYGETVEEAVVREVFEETSFKTEVHMPVGVYSRPDRDPRGHTVSCVFIMRRLSGKAKAGDDAAAVKWLSWKEPVELAFDHAEILKDAVKFFLGQNIMKK
ncbi:MAG: NUDIX domain-containing protein [Candidatus Thermoplasmatota archaeon]|nr:NUDIX domain-containing protein [Candidatus Thermoplasmatota archaeon]